jgi:glycosyltransferase involved in cell wall biosynthesis
VYTSAYEGQGMPPLEAIACGTPVVAMDNTAIPEAVGNAGILVSEKDSDADGQKSLAEALIAVATDTDAQLRLRARCQEHAGRFTATRFARQLEDCYEQAIAVRRA